MPYSADLRAGYFKLNLNMSWFYEVMTERGVEFDFMPHTSLKQARERCEKYGSPYDETKEIESHTELTINLFENYVEEWFDAYTKMKLFNCDTPGLNIDMYPDVWDCLQDKCIDYCQKHTEVKMIDKLDESDAEESE